MQEFKLESHDYNGRYLYVECTQEPVTAENKSIIHWTLTVTGGKASYYTTGPTTLKIGEQQVYYSPIVYYNAPKFPASKGSISGTVEIAHRDDGSKSLEVSLETAIYTSTLKTARATWELDAIPRASTVGATDCYIGGTCMVLVDRKNNACTHTLALYTDALEGYLGSDGSLQLQPVHLTATGISFPVPTSFYGKIPNERKLKCSLVCTTYLGETQMGQSQSCTFFATCREEECLPLVEAAVADCNEATLALTGDPNVLVRFFSRAACRLDALARNGAAIAQKQVNGREMGEELELGNVETGTFLFAATDSRGYREECTLEMPLIPYKKLTANCVVHRQAPTDNRVLLTLSGDWWAGNFGAAENTLQAFCRVGDREIPLTVTQAEDTYTAIVTVEELPYDKASFLTVTVADKLMARELSVTVNPGVPVFDWGEKDFAFHVPVTLADGSAAISQAQLMNILAQLGLIT